MFSWEETNERHYSNYWINKAKNYVFYNRNTRAICTVKIAAMKVKNAVEKQGEAAEEELGVEEAAWLEGALPVTVVILSFIPWSQWPAVPQAKYLVPGLFSLTTSLPALIEFTELLISQLLYELSPSSSTTLWRPGLYLNTARNSEILEFLLEVKKINPF